MVVFYCCFNFHLLNDIGCTTFFHVLICFMHVFFIEVSVQVFGPFLVRLFIFLLLKFESSLYISDVFCIYYITLLYEMYLL
jgi:hypothetical protein